MPHITTTYQGTYFNENIIEIKQFSYMRCHLDLYSVILSPFSARWDELNLYLVSTSRNPLSESNLLFSVSSKPIFLIKYEYLIPDCGMLIILQILE